MNPIIKILTDQKINEEKIKELFVTLTSNPMAAVGIVGSIGIPPEKLQELMGMIMTNPGLIKEAVEELGLDMAALEKAKQQLQ